MRGIIEAAIMIDGGNIFAGKRHHLILQRLKELGLTDKYKKYHENGFIVITDNYNLVFKSTEECTKWAKENGLSMAGSVLTSEDIIAEDAELPTYLFFGDKKYE